MLLQVGRLSRGLALVAAHRQIRFKLCEFGVRELARKKAGIEAGDRLVMELPGAATWPDGKVTVLIAGTVHHRRGQRRYPRGA
jgi:hypothetical protein